MLTGTDKVQKFVKYLMDGQRIEIEGSIYALSSNNEIGIVCLDENLNPTNKVLEISNAGFSFIVNLANKVSDDQYFLLGANNVLSNLNRKGDNA